MENESTHKAGVFNALATAIDNYAWITASLLKEKFGTIDDEEEYKSIQQEVVEYVESEEFKESSRQAEIKIFKNIIATAVAELEVLTDGDD